jgi:hypothetical protein
LGTHFTKQTENQQFFLGPSENCSHGTDRQSPQWKHGRIQRKTHSLPGQKLASGVSTEVRKQTTGHLPLMNCWSLSVDSHETCTTGETQS